MIEIVRTDETDEKFLALVKLLDIELAKRDGDEHAFYAQFNAPVGLAGVVLAYDGGIAVGCGAFKQHSDDIAEIKRMFVLAGHRGKRVAARILEELEGWAVKCGFAECILETGFKQPEAIALYKRSGYHLMPNYGQYEGVENSVCMKKRLN